MDAPLRNLGPASWRMLARAGIVRAAQLNELGAARAYVTVERAGARPSLNLLWAIEGALTGRDWKAVAATERTRLLMQLDDPTIDTPRAILDWLRQGKYASVNIAGPRESCRPGIYQRVYQLLEACAALALATR